MFSSITWGQYISAIIFVLFIYYILIGFIFFKWEILSLVGIKKISDEALTTSAALINLKEFTVTENNEDYLPKSAENDNSPLVHSFTDELDAFVGGADKNDLSKEQIMYSLQSICSKYPTIKNSECRNDLEAHLQTEINLKYPGLFQHNDFKKIWN